MLLWLNINNVKDRGLILTQGCRGISVQHVRGRLTVVVGACDRANVHIVAEQQAEKASRDQGWDEPSKAHPLKGLTFKIAPWAREHDLKTKPVGDVPYTNYRISQHFLNDYTMKWKKSIGHLLHGPAIYKIQQIQETMQIPEAKKTYTFLYSFTIVK